jgi:hypothetical protein
MEYARHRPHRLVNREQNSICDTVTQTTPFEALLPLNNQFNQKIPVMAANVTRNNLVKKFKILKQSVSEQASTNNTLKS